MATVSLASNCFRRIQLFRRQFLLDSVQYNLFQSSQTTANYGSHSSESCDKIDEMKKLLNDKFPLSRNIDIEDISGGCGAMFEVLIETVEFKGLPIIKQHQLVNDALKDHIKEMHGIRIKTIIPTGDIKQ